MAAAAIDQAVATLFLEALHPDAIELGLAMMREVDRQQADLDRQWTLRLERARYEAHLAERRYKAVDPEHRTVARTLEREWEVKLSEVQQLEREHTDTQVRDKLVLTPADRARILELSHEVPRIWTASTTTMAQRKAMVRTLVGEVSLTPLEGPEGGTRVRLLWQTGAVSELTVARQIGGRRISPVASEKIRVIVAAETPAALIAEALNNANLCTRSGRPWTTLAVYAYCRVHGVHRPHRVGTAKAQPERRSDGAYSLRGVARRLHVTEVTLRYWIHRGWLTGVERAGRGRAQWFQLNPATLARLKRVRAAHVRPRRVRAGSDLPRFEKANTRALG